jgi:hypothetical protein
MSELVVPVPNARLRYKLAVIPINSHTGYDGVIVFIDAVHDIYRVRDLHNGTETNFSLAAINQIFIILRPDGRYSD